MGCLCFLCLDLLEREVFSFYLIILRTFYYGILVIIYSNLLFSSRFYSYNRYALFLIVDYSSSSYSIRSFCFFIFFYAFPTFYYNPDILRSSYFYSPYNCSIYARYFFYKVSIYRYSFLTLSLASPSLSFFLCLSSLASVISCFNWRLFF